jgi:transposase
MRYELTDYEWASIKPMLPNKPRGVPRVDDRRVLNGIFWVLRSGAPRRDLPLKHSPLMPATRLRQGFDGFGAGPPKLQRRRQAGIQFWA